MSESPVVPEVLAPEPLESGTVARIHPLTPDEPAPGWPPALRVLFRFVCLYFVLYNLPAPLSFVPVLGGVLYTATMAFWAAAAPTLAGIVGLGRDFPLQPTGSGDMTINWVIQCTVLGAALIGTAIWTLAARARSYHRGHEWLRLIVRVVLATTMFSYGMFKVVPLQFPAISPERLVQPLGDFSPMGLLWTFMGFSVAYNVFTGLAEVVGGLLLMFRRTTTLGALVIIGVMSNVAMLNFTYDVPVKLYSVNLLLMAVFLVAPDARRLLNVLVLNRPAEPARPAAFFRDGTRHRRVVQATVVVLLLLLALQVRGATGAHREYGRGAEKPFHHGVFDVENFTRNGQEEPALPGDAGRWKRLAGGLFSVSIYGMDDARVRYRAVADTTAGTLTLTPFGAPVSTVLRYELLAEGGLLLAGEWGDDTIEVRLRRREATSFLLTGRGFHWVSEAPFNR